MTSLKRSFGVAAASAALILGAALVAPVQAQSCVNKAGQGTGGTVDNAKFQAWEAVLQATSWPMWAQFMSGSQKVGDAPGYKVSGLKSKCNAGGLGQVCVIQATLCK
jgi:hypothetical protein